MSIRKFTLHLLLKGIVGLQLTGIQVPEEAHAGGNVVLDCNFQLGNSKLQTVKWFKDGERFFKFEQDARYQIKVGRVNGIDVDEGKSDMHKVTLRKVSVISQGTYKCEVSSKGPAIENVSASANMSILVIPVFGPFIEIPGYKYDLGETVYANCTSGKTYPLATLEWFFNDVKVKPDSLSEGQNSTEGLLFESFSLISFVGAGKPGLFEFTCVASIGSIQRTTRLILHFDAFTLQNN